MVKAEVKDGQLVVSIPLNPPRPSTSGKTLVVASSGGPIMTEAQIDGKTVKVNLSAFIAKS